MNILAIETAGPHCSVMLDKAGSEFFRFENTSQRHSRHILGMIEQVLLEADIQLEEVGLLAWNAGPGSFTGLRVGASVVQALSYSHQLPVISLSSLELLAQAALKNSGAVQMEPVPIAVAVDAQMSGIYWASFVWQEGDLRRLESDQLIQKEDLEEKQQQIPNASILIGDAWLPNSVGGFEQISAANVMAVSKVGLSSRQLTQPTDCLPNYVHNTINWQKRQLKRTISSKN